jgi:hypothetical protein
MDGDSRAWAGRRDSLYNPQTGLGDDSEDTLDTRKRSRRVLDTYRQAHFWNSEWLQSWTAQREVSQLANDLVRKGVRIEGLPEWVDTKEVHEIISADLDYRADGAIKRTPGLLHYIKRLCEQGDKVGGAVLLPLIVDGMDPIEPLDWRRIKRIDGWLILDRSEISPFSYSGTTSEPEFYVLSDVLSVPDYDTGKRGPSAVGAQHQLVPGDIIHRSRLAFNIGVELSRREMRRRQWWGASKLELNMLARESLEYGDSQLATYIDRTVTMNFQIGGLDELRSRCDEQGVNVGEADVERAFRGIVQRARGTGFLVTDGGTPSTQLVTDGQQSTIPGRNPDKIEQIVTPTDALVAINGYYRDQWQAGAGIPRSIAFGEAPSGLRGGKNEGDWQSWQGVVGDRQTWATMILKWLLSLEFAAKFGPSGGVPVDPNSYTVHWNGLLTPTPKEEAEIAQVWAEIDGLRQSQAVQRPDETRQHRVVDGQLAGPVPALETEETDETGLTTSLVGIATNSLDIFKAVTAGELTPAAAAYLLRKQDPERFTDADEAVGLAVPAKPEQDAEAPADPLSARFETMSADLRSAKDIAAEMSRATGLGWTPQRVHALAKQHGLERLGFGRLQGYPMQFFRELAVSVDADRQDMAEVGSMVEAVRRVLLELDRMTE